MKRLTDFSDEILKNALADKPKNIRNGQAIFNYIDAVYHVARDVQFVDDVDCFYDDEQIEKFIIYAYFRIYNI